MDYFAHKVAKAQLSNGVVRLEFAVLKPDENGNFNPDAPVRPDEVTFSVNLPLPGFARSMAAMRDLMKDLQEKGILKGGEGQGQGGQGQPGGQGGQGGQGGGMPQIGQQRRNANMRDLTRDDNGGKPIV